MKDCKQTPPAAFPSRRQTAQRPARTAPAPGRKNRLLLWVASGLACCFVASTGLLIALRPAANADEGIAQGQLEIIDPNAEEVAKAMAPISASAGTAEAEGQVTITVNGTPAVSVANEQAAQTVLTNVLSSQTVENGKAEFVDKVEVTPYAEGSSVLGQEEATMVLCTEKALNVKCTVEKTEEEAIPFETVKKNDSSLVKGSTKTTTQGEEGLRRKTTTITYLNGQETARKEGEFKTVKEPVDKVVLVGTKNKTSNNNNNNNGSAIKGAPSFGWPVSGRITSPYGTRDGRLHAGIDIGKPIGSAVKASAAGTVTRAGSAGDYGILVEINHGNGWVTRYAHNSSVKVGQKVSKGQTIALSGNTGRSTGPHVHFEIRYNGSAKNPMTYLP